MRPTLQNIICLTTLLAIAALPAARAADTPVYMANGIKIGEVTQNRAIVWTRLTAAPERNASGFPFPRLGSNREAGVGKTLLEITAGHPLAEMEGSAPGVPGLVRILCWSEKDPKKRTATDWRAVDTERDFTLQFPLEGLDPATQYILRAEGKPREDAQTTCTVDGRFRTAPEPGAAAPVSFMVVTGQDYHRRDDPDNGHQIYAAMRKLDPDFFAHTGDIEYYDKAMPYATNQDLARFKWNRIYAMPFQRAFHNKVASYFIKDDHDTVKNDCWPKQHYGDLTWEQGLAIFREQVPMGLKTYRTVRWGQDLQVWLVEGRDFRSPNTMRDGPDKTIWGTEQKEWFKRTVTESDASFRVLISPTPLVGPDRTNKGDNHANKAFAHEGRELRAFIAGQKDMVVINGDRHWQYISVDGETGLREYSTGPTSDKHAGGWKQEDLFPEHRYLNVKGGFLHVTVKREDGKPTMRLQHRGVQGQVYHEDLLTAG